MENALCRRLLLQYSFAMSIMLSVGGSLLSPYAAAEQAPAQSVKVTVLLFSGRPDPNFELTEPEQARLSALLREAPRQERAAGATVIPSILGYKGIVVDNAAALAPLPRRLAVYGGSIEVGTERKEYFADPGNRVASFLLELAIEKGTIPEPVVKRIREQGLR